MANVLERPDFSRIDAVPVETLAAVLDQSLDCVKLVGLDGRVSYMNANGQCAMEIDNVDRVLGQEWTSLWPESARGLIRNACAAADKGEVSRFNAYCPTAKNSPRWWNVSVSPIQAVDGSITGYVSISRDVTEAELARQALETTAAEMRHRLSNSFAMVGGLLSAYASGDPVRETFANEMIGRLQALGAAQTLFAREGEAPCLVADLVEAMVGAFDVSSCPVILKPVPEIKVDQGKADAIALVIGELAVNSVKHGALGAGGEIAISASASDGRFQLVWDERSDRPVSSHSRTGGKGFRLMDRVVRARRGQMTTEWRDDGLQVILDFEHL